MDFFNLTGLYYLLGTINFLLGSINGLYSLVEKICKTMKKK